MKPLKWRSCLIKLKISLKELELSFLQILLLIYVFFIPIWPKLPFKFINYTYIAVRYEDFFVAFIVLVFIFELIRKKIKLKNNPLLITIISYWLIAILSVLIGFYFLKTIITLELGLLHSLRRVEYMIVFFIIYATLDDFKQTKLFLNALMIVLFIVSVYGIGQKFFGWPAIQTMNPHYSKGYLLTLDVNSRISSTFGGHYDFAAYLVVMMPLALALYISTKAKQYFLVFVTALLSLILTASRVSYVAYSVSVPLFLLFIRQFKLLVVVIVLTILLTPLSNNLTKRINRTFRQELVWISPETGQAIVPREITADDLPAGDYIIKKKDQTAVPVLTDNTSREALLVKKEIREVIVKKAKNEGKKLTVDQVELLVNETFAKFKPVSTVLPDISFATRLQVEWPRAVKAFLKNPATGTGPSSITEATDNDFLRALGEVGLVGFTLFFLAIAKIHLLIWKKARKLNQETKAVFLSILFGTFALLTNALYIDVFEASKVALTIWFLWGLMLKTATFSDKELNNSFSKEK